MDPVQSFQQQLEAYQHDPEFRFQVLIIDIGEQICGELNARGIDQSAPPPGSGISQSTWNRLRNGDKSTTILTVVKVATALGKHVRVTLG